MSPLSQLYSGRVSDRATVSELFVPKINWINICQHSALIVLSLRCTFLHVCIRGGGTRILYAHTRTGLLIYRLDWLRRNWNGCKAASKSYIISVFLNEDDNCTIVNRLSNVSLVWKIACPGSIFAKICTLAQTPTYSKLVQIGQNRPWCPWRFHFPSSQQ